MKGIAGSFCLFWCCYSAGKSNSLLQRRVRFTLPLSSNALVLTKMFLDVLHGFFVLYSFSMFRIVSFWNSWNLRVLLAISFWKRWKLYVFLRLCCPAGIKEMNTFFLPKRLNHDCTEVSHKFPYTWGKTLPLRDYNTLTKRTLWDIMIFHLWDRWSFLIARIPLKSRTVCLGLVTSWADTSAAREGEDGCTPFVWEHQSNYHLEEGGKQLLGSISAQVYSRNPKP